MNSLITASLKAANIQPLIEFPRFLLSEWEQKVIDYIIAYNSTYGEPPRVSRVTREYEEFVPIMSEDPLLDVRDQELASKRSQYAAGVLEQELNDIKKGKEFDIDKHLSRVEQLSVTASTIERYSDFDRRLYFRSGKVKLGLPFIDKVTKGVGNGEVMLVVGRLGVGKSTLLQFFTHRWLSSGMERILFISKEMPPVDVFARMDSIVGSFNPLSLREDDVETRIVLEKQLEIVQNVVKKTGTEVFMPKMNVWAVEQIGALARTLGVDAIVVDGVYHLTTETASRYMAGWENLTQVSRALKAVAMDTKVPMLTTSQLKRGAGQAAKFSDEDIAFADALGQDADFILGIKPLGVPHRMRAELQLIKNRYGPEVTNIIELRYDTMTMRDVSMEGDVEE